MFMKRDTSSAIFIVAISVAVAVIVWIYYEINTANSAEKISAITGTISALVAAGALILAILVYKKFGIEQRLLNRQFDLIYELIEEISKKKFILKSADRQENIPTAIIFYVPRIEINSGTKNDQKILISDTYESCIRGIEALGNNLLMPSLIAKKILTLSIDYIDQTKGVELAAYKGQNYFVVEDNNPGSEEKYRLVGKLNGEEITLEQFDQRWKELINTVETWLQENASFPVQLNR